MRAEVFPGKGFLESTHTLENWRESLFLPQLADRTRHDAWCEGGSRDMAERARQRARELLDSHQPEPLPATAQAEIEKVLRERQST